MYDVICIISLGWLLVVQRANNRLAHCLLDRRGRERRRWGGLNNLSLSASINVPLSMAVTPDQPQACVDDALLASADPCYWIRLVPGRFHTLRHVGTSGYSLSAGQGGYSIRTYLLCSLTYDLSMPRCSDWSPYVLWHTWVLSQSNTNIYNQVKPISPVLRDCN